MTPEHQRCAPKEEFFITDVAYCEQAVIFLKQAKLPQLNMQRRKEDGTLPVSSNTLPFSRSLSWVSAGSHGLQEHCGSLKNFISKEEVCKCSIMKQEENLEMEHDREILQCLCFLHSFLLVGVKVYLFTEEESHSSEER